jgi:hypothetical protein
MSKYHNQLLIFYCFVSLFLLLGVSELPAQLVKEVKVLENDTIFHQVYIYDNEGNIVLETSYYQQAGTWIRRFQTEWAYKTGKCIRQTGRMWKTTKWQSVYQIDIDYSIKLQRTEIHSLFNGSQLVNNKKIIYQYAQDSILTNRSYHIWETDSWVLERNEQYLSHTNNMPTIIQLDWYQNQILKSQLQYLFQYTDDKLPLNQVFKSKVSGEVQWHNTDSACWYYENKMLKSIRKYNWDNSISKWVHSSKTDYDYDINNRLVTQCCSRWNLVAWLDEFKYKHQYDSIGRETKYEIYSKQKQNWRNIASVNYLNYINNQVSSIQSHFEFWGGEPNSLVAMHIPFKLNNKSVEIRAKTIDVFYENQVVDTVSSTDSIIQTVSVYPNPSRGIYYIASPFDSIENWSISTTEGKVLMSENNLQSKVIDISDFQTGVYILVVHFKGMKYTQRLVKI